MLENLTSSMPFLFLLGIGAIIWNQSIIIKNQHKIIKLLESQKTNMEN